MLSRFTSDAGPETNPTWSPDGKRMVFGSVQNGEITNLHYGRATP
ncbi:MAG: hypothetical protein DMG19_19390, partial [Acidobacteria bacterium]